MKGIRAAIDIQDWYQLLQKYPPVGEEMNPSLGLGLYLARLKGRGYITFEQYLAIEDLMFRGKISYLPGNE